MSFFIETLTRRRRMLEEWGVWAERIAGVAREVLPGARVYVVGSIVRGDYVASSDVDILIVSENAPESARERARIKASIEEHLGLPYYHPFEIHILKPSEATNYLRRTGGHIVEVKQA